MQRKLLSEVVAPESWRPIMITDMAVRVAITGIGVVSPFGIGRERFWRCVKGGCSATRAITDFDASPFPCTVAAPVPPVSIEDIVSIDDRAPGAPPERIGRPDPRRYSRASLIAVIAGTEAWADAGLRAGESNAGVLVGSGAGGIDVAERQYFEFFTDGWKRVTPYAIPVSIVGMISSEISIALELHGISSRRRRLHQFPQDAISMPPGPLIRGGEADVILFGRRRRSAHAGMIFGSKMRGVATECNDLLRARHRARSTPADSLCSRRRVDDRSRA